MKATLIKEAGGYDLYRIDEDGKRVTFASTQDYKQKLSLKNCQAIERGYDLDELVKREYLDGYDTTELCRAAFKDGFQKALEILGDKKFSAGQLLNAMDLVWQWINGEDYGCKTLTEVQDKHIQSLQQTEWDVEVEMEFNPINHASGLELIGNVLMDVAIQENYKPKLDADGCLILKRV